MAHFCHLLFPHYAKALPTVQPTEPTAAFPGFQMLLKNLPQPDDRTELSLGLDRVKFKASIFLLLQK